jgi:hypothetical protein
MALLIRSQILQDLCTLYLLDNPDLHRNNYQLMYKLLGDIDGIQRRVSELEDGKFGHLLGPGSTASKLEEEYILIPN